MFNLCSINTILWFKEDFQYAFGWRTNLKGLLGVVTKENVLFGRLKSLFEENEEHESD